MPARNGLETTVAESGSAADRLGWCRLAFMPFDLAAALPLLLPRAIAWAEAREAETLGAGTALSPDDGVALARAVGVERAPEIYLVPTNRFGGLEVHLVARAGARRLNEHVLDFERHRRTRIDRKARQDLFVLECSQVRDQLAAVNILDRGIFVLAGPHPEAWSLELIGFVRRGVAYGQRHHAIVLEVAEGLGALDVRNVESDRVFFRVHGRAERPGEHWAELRVPRSDEMQGMPLHEIHEFLRYHPAPQPHRYDYHIPCRGAWNFGRSTGWSTHRRHRAQGRLQRYQPPRKRSSSFRGPRADANRRSRAVRAGGRFQKWAGSILTDGRWDRVALGWVSEPA